MLKDSQGFNLPKLEEKILEFWKKNRIFEKSLEQRRGSRPFRFFEGPPTANGKPGIHHVLGRSFKDVVLRYKAMRNYFVLRRAGWDTHGLPVELEIEKELGIKTRHEIEKFGIAEFNAKAKESIWRYKNEWEKLTERLGFWLDLNNPYITYDNKYIETLWWILSKISEKKLLKKSFKVVPWCMRCQTPLSTHEMGQPGAYRKAKDPSIYIKFKLKEQKAGTKKINEYFLAWTTTPWTLPSNVALAIDPCLTYTKYVIKDSHTKTAEFVWSFNAPPQIDGKEISVVEKMSGRRLVGKTYEPLYKFENSDEKYYKVLSADFIETEDGTGIVHIAPAFGEEDFELIQKNWGKLSNSGRSAAGVDFPITVTDDGMVLQGLPGSGKFIKNADEDVLKDLKARGLLYYFSHIEHDYPFCWRCSQPLIYLARLSWFIEITKLQDKLLKLNEKINWVPEAVKHGRFGGWLKCLKDWSLSRERYWGTPLPIWECIKCEKSVTIGAFKDLDEHSFDNKFYVMRHTESTHNVNNICAGGPETLETASHLTKKGELQAQRVGKKLKRLKVDLIFASPFSRTKEVAAIASKATGIPVVFDKRLEEINTGIFNGRPISEYRSFFSCMMEKFTKIPPGGENLNDVRKRMWAFLKEVNTKYSGKKILIISHGDPIWMLKGISSGLIAKEIVDDIDGPAVGEVDELKLHNFPKNEYGELDSHRPFVDEVRLRCPKCSNVMLRVKEVADVWFDSGAMPFAQWHYPFENKALVDKGAQYPADYISEGIDQTRGWFYTLLAVGALLDKGQPFNNVIALGLVLDKNGQKMSKSKGNIVDPWQMFGKYGADIVRWYFYTTNDPGEFKRFDEADLLKITKEFVLMIYNSYNFWDSYACKDYKSNFKPRCKNILDKWILARLDQAILNSTENLEKYFVREAGLAIRDFVEDLSRWYIRRSRERFQSKSDNRDDWLNASYTLEICLLNLAKLLAPFMPFFAEALYRSLIKESNLDTLAVCKKSIKESVHLTDWPTAKKASIDRELLEDMQLIKHLATEALGLRNKFGLKVRQPLASLKIKNQELRIKNNDELLRLLKDEINVKDIIFCDKIKEPLELDMRITPELREEGLGRELIRIIQDLRKEARLKPKDVIAVFVQSSKEINEIAKSKNVLRKIIAKSVEIKKESKILASRQAKINEADIWVGIKRMPRD